MSIGDGARVELLGVFDCYGIANLMEVRAERLLEVLID